MTEVKKAPFNNFSTFQNKGQRPGGFTPRRDGDGQNNNHHYRPVRVDAFDINPLDVPSGKTGEVPLSSAAIEFLRMGANRIQVQNPETDQDILEAIDELEINYKNIPLLKRYISQFGLLKNISSMDVKIRNRRKRLLKKAVEQARFLGLLTYPDQRYKK